jgi:hypothetical protein
MHHPILCRSAVRVAMFIMLLLAFMLKIGFVPEERKLDLDTVKSLHTLVYSVLLRKNNI